MKKSCFLPISLLLPLFAFSQTRFNKLIDEPTKWQSGEGIVQLPDGGYLIAASDLPANQDGKIALLRTDADGNLTERTTIQDTGHYLNPVKDCLRATPDNAYMLMATDYNRTNWNAKALFVKINIAGEVLWMKKSGIDGNQVITSIMDFAFESGGHFVFCGVLDSANMPNRIILGKADENGDIIWQKLLDSLGGSGETAVHLTLTPDGGFALAVLRFVSFPNIDNVVLKFDHFGNLQWEQMLGQTFFDSAVPSIAALPDGSLLFVGGQDSLPGITRAYAAKLAPNGAVIWSNTYGLDDVNTSFFTRPIVLPDGSFVVAGGPRVDSDFNQGGQLQLLKIDPDGNLLWRRRHYYIPNAIHDGRAMIPTADGGFALTGVVHKSNVHDVWLLKTDSLGCAVENCALVGTGMGPAPDVEPLYAYPNPVSDRLYIESPRTDIFQLRILGVDGSVWEERSLVNQPAVRRLEIHTERWPAGMYLALIRTATGQRSILVVKP